MIQTVFTIITEVDPSKLDDLRALVAVIAADPVANAVIPFGSLDGLHFASIVLAQAQAEALPPTLIVEQNVDGSLDAWLDVLVAQARTGLDSLYSHCTGYPVGADSASMRSYLAQHVVRPGAYHIGATGRSLARIRQESDLRQAIEAFLDAQVAAGTLPATGAAVRSAVQSAIGGEPAFSWAGTSPKFQTTWQRLGHLAHLVGVVILAILFLPVLLPILLVWVIVLRSKEKSDPVLQHPADRAHIEAVSDAEDFFAQNHLASVIPVKPGLLRAVTLPTVLYALNLVVRVKGTKGQLGGIPSIHFAHWSRINGGRHLMFLSNFDGSWENYLGDFIDKAASGLTAVWSNTVNFPRTRFLLRAGARNGPLFIDWARASQCPTAAWYTAYPTSTMPNIQNNSSIREGLFGSMGEQEVQAWLRRL